MIRARAVLFSLAAALTGCSTASSSNALVDVVSDSLCEQLLHCDLGNDAVDRTVVDTRAECEAILDGILGNNVFLQAYIDNGTVKINQQALSECRSAIAADPCVDLGDIGACDNLYRGTVRDGDGCAIDAQCVSGACTANFGQCGTCVASVGVGQTCDPAQDNCLQTSGGTVDCETGPSGSTCVFHPDNYLTVGVGAECGRVNGVEQVCGTDLYCDANDFCAVRKPAGSPCDPDLDECAYGTLCGDNGNAWLCINLVKVTTAGSACGEFSNGSFGVCDLSRGLYCGFDANDNQICIALAGTGTENSQCITDADCNGGLVCVAGDVLQDGPGTCETTNKPVGFACDVDAECATFDCRFSLAAGEAVCSEPVVCP